MVNVNLKRKLDKKVAVVTEANRGIGQVLAERLARDGATVVVHYAKNEDLARGVADGIVRAGGWATPLQANLTRLSEIRRLFAEVEDHFQRLDILVNSAGAAERKPLESIDETHYESMFGLNVRTLLFATQEAIRRFGPGGGRVINVSSMLGGRPAPCMAVYAATKAAISSLTRSLAAELGPRGVTVNAVTPDMTDPSITLPKSPNFWEDLIRSSTLSEIGRVDDIADAVAFLCSDDARSVTGRILCAGCE